MPVELGAVDRHRPGLELDLLPTPRELVRSPALYLDRRVGGRTLLLLADRDRQLVGQAARVNQLAVTIAGVRYPAQPGHGSVGLRQRDQEALRARGAADQHEQQPRGERVQRPGVAHPGAARQCTAHLRHHVMRGHPRRLCAEQDAGRAHRLDVL